MCTPCVWENFVQSKPIVDKVFCLCHICCVCSVSEIFSNYCIKLFWCLTVVVGLIKLYYIKIFIFLNLCLTEHWSIYLLICAYCAWLHCLVLKYSWFIIYYMILSLFVSYGLLLGWALFRFCSVFVLCCSFSTIQWWSQSKCFICISW